MRNILLTILPIATVTLLAGCGGGGGSSTPPPPVTSATSVASSIESSSVVATSSSISTSSSVASVASSAVVVASSAVMESSIASSAATSSQSSSSLSSVATSASSSSKSLAASSSSSSVAVGNSVVYEAEDNFFSGSVTNAGTYLKNFTGVGARVIFTVNSPAAGTYTINLSYANSSAGDKTLNIYVNGLLNTATTFTATGGDTTWGTKVDQVALREGVNTITYQYDSGNTGGVNIDALAVQGALPLTVRGATLPYQEYEAEDGITNATVSAANRTYLTVESESSGRHFVGLNTNGNYVDWVASKAANALVVRYSIPDAPAGGGTNATLSLYINGVKAKSLALSSHYAWNYGAYPFTDNPADGKGHHFFDESRFAGLDIPAGATVRLQKDAGDTAAYYNIDLVDLEKVDAPYTMPANFVDLTTYGALPDDNVDDMTALVSAIAAAKSLGKGVWIPAGTFILSGRPDVSGVQIRGAGVWYTELHGINGKGGFRGQGNNVTIADMRLSSDSIVRKDALDNPGFEGNFGSGSLIQNVWIEHMKVGLWLANCNGLFVVNGRVRDTWADGVNFAGGMTKSAVNQFNFRNTGDDSMAMWSTGTANVNNTFRYNTAQLPMLANTFALYGGQDNKIFDSIGSDTVLSASGIQMSTRFSSTSFGGTTEARRNTLNRTGGYDPAWNTTFGGLWIYAEGQTISSPMIIDTVDINDSTYDGILLSYNQKISNLTINNVNVNGAGNYGIEISAMTGAGTFSNLVVKDAVLGGINNFTGFTLTRGDGNSGW